MVTTLVNVAGTVMVVVALTELVLTVNDVTVTEVVLVVTVGDVDVTVTQT